MSDQPVAWFSGTDFDDFVVKHSRALITVVMEDGQRVRMSRAEAIALRALQHGLSEDPVRARTALELIEGAEHRVAVKVENAQVRDNDIRALLERLDQIFGDPESLELYKRLFFSPRHDTRVSQ